MISKSIGIIQRLLNEPLRPTECFPQRHIIDDEELLEIRHDINDLDLYRKIEQELGIDLITLIKALKQKKVWFKTYFTEEIKIIESCFELEIYTDKNNKLLCWLWFEDYGYQIQARTYGKTWALTKAELEK